MCYIICKPSSVLHHHMRWYLWSICIHCGNHGLKGKSKQIFLVLPSEAVKRRINKQIPQQQKETFNVTQLHRGGDEIREAELKCLKEPSG